MPSFAHLHVHTEYSLLDGLSRLSPLIAQAKALGMDALAVTDHGAMYAAIEFYTKAKEAGIKPIIGCEAYMAPRGRQQREPRLDNNPYHLTLLAQDRTGYKNLIKLSTEAHLSGYYYRPRLDRELLAGHAKGIIALSGCPSAEIPRLLLEGNLEGARRSAAWFKELFGPQRFYIELQEHGIPEHAGLSALLVSLARELELPLVATNDVHYTLPTDVHPHEVLLCIQTNTSIEDPNRMRYGESFYLKSPQEMAALFPELPEAVNNTAAIAEMCNLRLDFSRLHLPDFAVPEGETVDSHLARRCWEGLQRRYQPVTAQAEERLRYELSVIEQTGFALYILIVADFVDYARQNGILFGVRGSAAASIVCYCLGITDIDPLEWDLAFERFLNVERKQMPDIDMDFADDRRGEMIDYVVKKYGRDHVAQIITFGTLGARAAIRDVGRVLGVPLGIVDQVAKLVPPVPVGITIDRAMEVSPELRARYQADTMIRTLMDTAKGVEGVARNASTHAAGVVISRDPLTEHVPLQKPTRPAGKAGNEDTPSVLMTQYPMEALEKIGLLKMDFLGLANLTILGRTVEIVRQTRGLEIDLQKIPPDDAATFQMLGEGETTSIFQLEGSGMRRYVKELKPTSIADLAAMVALYRPGPMQSIPQYIRAKHGEIPITYLHPRLKSILEPTYGVLVYQDQVLFIAREVAGYSLGRADILRKAMGKKIKEEMAGEQSVFLEGARKKGIDPGTALQIWNLIEPFAGYGFNKAHAACYAQIAYQTAYLKANYPVEYMCAVLQSAMGNLEKVATAVAECRRLDIPVLPPDINRSGVNFTIEPAPGTKHGQAIRFALASIKNVGEGAVGEMVAAQEKGGPFQSTDDFCRRAGVQALNKRVMESLIKAGAFDRMARRSQLLAVLDRLISTSQTTQHARDIGQASLFDFMPSVVAVPLVALPDVPEVDYKEKLAWEKEFLGTYLSEHPLQKVALQLKDSTTTLCGEIDLEMEGQIVGVAGMITNLRQITTKKGDLMLFVQLEDLQGSIEVTVFPRIYERTKDVWAMDRIVLVKGKVDVRNDRPQIICDAAAEYKVEEAGSQGIGESGGAGRQGASTQVASKQGGSRQGAADQPISKSADRQIGNQKSEIENRKAHLHIILTRSKDTAADTKRLQAVKDVLQRYHGQDQFSLYLRNGQEQVTLRVPQVTTRYCPELEQELTAILGAGKLRVEQR
jgi:DNA polymerase-3 subunit alpha